MARLKRYNAECNRFEEILKSLKYEKWLFLKGFQWDMKLGLNFIKALVQAVDEELDWEGEEDAPERVAAPACTFYPSYHKCDSKEEWIKWLLACYQYLYNLYMQ